MGEYLITYKGQINCTIDGLADFTNLILNNLRDIVSVQNCPKFLGPGWNCRGRQSSNQPATLYRNKEYISQAYLHNHVLVQWYAGVRVLAESDGVPPDVSDCTVFTDP